MLDSIEKYWQEKAQYDQARNANNIRLHPEVNPMFNQSILFKTIEDRDTMSESELRYFIQHNFISIMNNIFNPEIGSRYVIAFEDARFLDAFIDIISQMQFLESDIVVRLNLVIYHYLTAAEEIKKPEIVRRMLNMGSIINRNKLIYLKKFNLPSDLENLLVIARYSDFDLNICVKRVNLLLITSQQFYDMLDVDDTYEVPQKSVEWLAKLLAELYRLEEWVYVLPYFMIDVIPERDEYNPNTLWVTPEVETADSAMCLAVLFLLDTMIDDSSKLRGILVSYAEGYRLLNVKKPVKFSFQRISNEYPRLNNVLYYLETEENIYVP